MKTYSMANGLPSSSITICVPGYDGMLWIATWNGLCNYDGYRFNSFVAPMGSGQVLTSNRLRALMPARNGDVWLTTFDGRLYKLNATEGKYIDYQPEINKLGLKNFEATSLACLENDVTWVLTKTGENLRISKNEIEIVKTDSPKNDFCTDVMLTKSGHEIILGENVVKVYGQKDGEYKIPKAKLCGNFIVSADRMAFLSQKDGKIMFEEIKSLANLSTDEKLKINAMAHIGYEKIAIATNHGVYLQEENHSKLQKLSDESLDNIFADKDNNLWSITSAGKVLNIKLATKETMLLECPQNAEIPRIMAGETRIHQDYYGTMWFFLPNGVFCHYNTDSKSLEQYDLRKTGGIIAPEISMQKSAVDKQGNIWFTNVHNLSVLTFNNYDFHFIPILAGVEVRSVAADQKGRIYAGTKGGNLVILDSKGNSIGSVTPQGTISKELVKFCNNGIYSIYADKSGNVWLGSRGDGLFLLKNNGAGGFTVKAMNTADGVSGVCGDLYFDICTDNNKRLWFGTYTSGTMFLKDDNVDGELNFITAQKKPTLRLPEGDMSKVRRVTYTDSGVLLFSSADGLLTMDSKTLDRYYFTTHLVGDTSSLTARDVLATLVCRKSKNIYVSTMGGGLQRIVSKNLLQDSLKLQSVANFAGETGNIQDMVEDSQGKIWLICENSIRCISPDGNEIVVCTSSNRGRDLVLSEGKTCIDKTTGNVIVAAMDGVLMFNPDELTVSSFKPSLVFSGVQYQGNERITPLMKNQHVTLSVGDRSAMVYFAALDYGENGNIHYAYRIKELHTSWSYVGQEHCAPLSNMPAGDYTLEVRSTNNDGVWQDNFAELKIHVEPTFWETPWAWAVYFLIFALLFYSVFYMMQLRNKAKLENQMKEKQLAFFTDISHQLRTPLTLICAPVLEVLNNEKLSEKSRNYLEFVNRNANHMLELVNKSLKLITPNNSPLVNDGDIQAADNNSAQKQMPTEETTTVADSSITILIVEDNNELRYFLVTTLSAHYNIIEAENGKVGLQMAAEHHPDFIITDIMMPEMDGITMIRHIKADNSVCHIPIIILSARTADTYRIEGLKEGADDYITKPFSISYLRERVESIIRQRMLLQEMWRLKLDGQSQAAAEPVDMPVEISLSQADQRFSDALTKFIEMHYVDGNLKIEDIANGLNLGRSVLYSKIKTIYGIPPNDLLRNYRLKRACSILTDAVDMTISEIAYSVGFSEPKYFARCFKQQFGLSPSEFRKKSGK